MYILQEEQIHLWIAQEDVLRRILSNRVQQEFEDHLTRQSFEPRNQLMLTRSMSMPVGDWPAFPCQTFTGSSLPPQGFQNPISGLSALTWIPSWSSQGTDSSGMSTPVAAIREHSVPLWLESIPGADNNAQGIPEHSANEVLQVQSPHTHGGDEEGSNALFSVQFPQIESRIERLASELSGPNNGLRPSNLLSPGGIERVSATNDGPWPNNAHFEGSNRHDSNEMTRPNNGHLEGRIRGDSDETARPSNPQAEGPFEQTLNELPSPMKLALEMCLSNPLMAAPRPRPRPTPAQRAIAPRWILQGLPQPKAHLPRDRLPPRGDPDLERRFNEIPNRSRESCEPVASDPVLENLLAGRYVEPCKLICPDPAFVDWFEAIR